MLKKILVCICIIFAFSACTAKETSQTNNSEPINNEITNSTETEFSNIDTHNRNNYFTVSNDNYIYIVSGMSIYKTDRTTGESVCVFTNEKYILKILLSDDGVYFTDVEYLYKLNETDGTAVKVAHLFDSDSNVWWTDAYSIGENIYLYSYGNEKYALIEETENGVNIEKISEDIRNILISEDNTKYIYKMTSDLGGGVLADENGEIICGDKFNIKGEKSFIIADNVVFYVSGKSSDFSSDLSLYRKNLTYGTDEKAVSLNSDIQFMNYDDKYVYYHDFTNYFRMDMQTFETEISPVTYDSGEFTEICEGELYRVQSNNPIKIDFITGETDNICQ